MILTGLQKQILKDGILGAYPSENDLEILLLEKMGLSYSAKARGDNYANRVAYLVIQLEARGEVEQLIKVIVEGNPNSPYLTQVKTEFRDILTQNVLPDELGLSPEKADQILGEELNGIHQISRPILEQAEIAYSFSQLDKVEQAQPQREQEKVRERSRPQEKLEPQLVEDLGKGVSLDMVRIPGGTFQMGSPTGQGDDNERPQHSVTVPPFFIGKYPITQAQWRAVAALPPVIISLDPNPSNFKGDSRPVEQVYWDEAVEFCRRISDFTGHQYRLPSEAEWEYACRAGTTTPFHFGETLTPRLARCKANLAIALSTMFNGETAPVGSYSPNSFGLYDMHGNVWEWCADDWHENYASSPPDGSAWITGENYKKRLCRGGSWYCDPEYCRSACRSNRYPNTRSYDIGFRVVCALFPIAANNEIVAEL